MLLCTNEWIEANRSLDTRQGGYDGEP